jgi:hypothetical protein
MICTMVANVVVSNRLEPVEEIENVQQTIEELYEKYLAAYNAEEHAR